VTQAFNWESWKGQYYKNVVKEANWYAEMGFTYVWLPPSVRSVSEQGYMPNDYFDLNSQYGSAEELKEAIEALKEAGLRVAGDCVLNHRCALNRDERGVYNRVCYQLHLFIVVTAVLHDSCCKLDLRLCYVHYLLGASASVA
jgi:alpha-amylase